ncbi:MAG: zinc-ribbon domain-containing protein [Bacilli bacterium]|nr:zinc-ribbon domain-containing protein [Bacilli bacterium]MBO4682499.1 zinc-ribbon domain-containing protein [Bacilli bacterium]
MALITCPECGKEISSTASACPHCGFQIANQNTEIEYETKTVTIGYWTKDGLDKKISPYLKEGWEVVTMKENKWKKGVARSVYDVVLRRPKRENANPAAKPVAITNDKRQKDLDFKLKYGLITQEEYNQELAKPNTEVDYSSLSAEQKASIKSNLDVKLEAGLISQEQYDKEIKKIR